MRQRRLEQRCGYSSLLILPLLPQAAWGTLQKKGTQLMIRSYELGVLLLPSLELKYLQSSTSCGFDAITGTCQKASVPCSLSFVSWDRQKSQCPTVSKGHARIPLPVPFALPPAPYGAGDQPWAVDVQWPGMDVWGRSILDAQCAHYGLDESKEWAEQIYGLGDD